MDGRVSRTAGFATPRRGDAEEKRGFHREIGRSGDRILILPPSRSPCSNHFFFLAAGFLAAGFFAAAFLGAAFFGAAFLAAGFFAAAFFGAGFLTAGFFAAAFFAAAFLA